MSTQHGAGEGSGTSPAEPAAAPDTADSAPAPVRADDAASADPGPDAEIRAAGGTVVGESEIAGRADRSRVRRAPRYKRFAVLGGLVGVLIAAVATPFATYDPARTELAGVSPWGLFLLLVTILVPFLILVSCAVAMFTDRAARVPARQTRKRKGHR